MAIKTWTFNFIPRENTYVSLMRKSGTLFKTRKDREICRKSATRRLFFDLGKFISVIHPLEKCSQIYLKAAQWSGFKQFVCHLAVTWVWSVKETFSDTSDTVKRTPED